MKMIDILELKPQHEMTKEDLAKENIELRKYIDRLESEKNRTSDVFQDGTLSEIIDACKEQAQEENQKKQLMPVGSKRRSSTNKKTMDDLMAQYSRYRKVFGEKPASKEVSLNMKVILQQNNE